MNAAEVREQALGHIREACELTAALIERMHPSDPSRFDLEFAEVSLDDAAAYLQCPQMRGAAREVIRG